VQQRRLAGAGRPHQRHQLSGLRLQVDAAQDVQDRPALPEAAHDAREPEQ
jgi:hypothetical protein